MPLLLHKFVGSWASAGPMLAYVGHVLGLLGLCWAYGASMLGLCWAYVASMLGLWRASLWCLGRTGVPKMKTAGEGLGGRAQRLPPK